MIPQQLVFAVGGHLIRNVAMEQEYRNLKLCDVACPPACLAGNLVSTQKSTEFYRHATDHILNAFCALNWAAALAQLVNISLYCAFDCLFHYTKQ